MPRSSAISGLDRCNQSSSPPQRCSFLHQKSSQVIRISLFDKLVSYNFVLHCTKFAIFSLLLQPDDVMINQLGGVLS